MSQDEKEKTRKSVDASIARSVKSEESYKVEKRQRLIGCLFSICSWFSAFRKRAARERKLYRQEGLYTVADTMPEDARIIATAKLPVIWILATPGSPITELVVRLCDCYGWYHLSLGALVQREISLETGREDEVHHLLHRGVSIPRAFIFELVRRQMANVCKKKSFKGFIFTDYPSTLTQINELKEYVCKPDFMLYLKFSEKLTQENLNIYLRFQVRASKVLRKLQPDVHVVSLEQTKKFKREIEKIYSNNSDIFKAIDASLPVEDVCRDIMKWIERASVMHHITPPLFVEPPLQDHSRETRELFR